MNRLFMQKIQQNLYAGKSVPASLAHFDWTVGFRLHVRHDEKIASLALPVSSSSVTRLTLGPRTILAGQSL